MPCHCFWQEPERQIVERWLIGRSKPTHSGVIGNEYKT